MDFMQDSRGLRAKVDAMPAWQQWLVYLGATVGAFVVLVAGVALTRNVVVPLLVIAGVVWLYFRPGGRLTRGEAAALKVGAVLAFAFTVATIIIPNSWFRLTAIAIFALLVYALAPSPRKDQFEVRL